MTIKAKELPVKEAPVQAKDSTTEEAMQEAKRMIGSLQEVAASLRGDYEQRLIFRDELNQLKFALQMATTLIDTTRIEEMEARGIKKSESVSFLFEWHQRSKSEWNKEGLTRAIEQGLLAPDKLVNLLYKGFQLSVSGLKELEAGETIINTCRVVREEEGKTLAVRLKKEG